MKILKFGGSSVSTPDRIKSVMDIVQSAMLQEKISVVFSAFGGVTDDLIRLSSEALEGNEHYRDHLKIIEDRHLETVRNLIAIHRQSGTLATVKATFNELEDAVQGIYLLRERTPRMLDMIMSFGERLSAYIISEAFLDRRQSCEFLDSRKIIRTDHHFGRGKVDFEITHQLIVEYFRQHSKLQIVTGFIASTENGETTTLGRSGSDYTAAILAAALQASSLEIWTDVDGMMTADPRKVKKAFSVTRMTYEEAMELSHFGAKVLFPSTMQPVMTRKIPIWIKNTFNPAFEGSLIDETGNGRDLMIKGISSISNLCLLSVQGSGLQGVVGVSMRLFGALAKENINIILISQASSEHSICLAVDTLSSGNAKKAIEKEFVYEIKGNEMDPVLIEYNLAIVAIVGENMRHNPGTSGRMFYALGKSGINVYAIAQGSSELNISAVILESDVAKALNVLHEAFFLSDRRVINLYLIGTGLIGTELISMIRAQFSRLCTQNLLEVKIVALANSKKMIVDENGLDLQDCIQKMKSEGAVMDAPIFFERMKQLNLSNSIFIDCTSSEEIASRYESVLEANISIVTPNKKANSGSLSQYHKLKSLAFKKGVRFLYETNVGAGLPVINTMNDLLLSGDKVIRIEAVLSGTLNYIFSSFIDEVPFSKVVREAKQKGFTEPDPRDDLNGMDVARKLLILARESGFDLELGDVQVAGLIPDERGRETVDEFLNHLERFDELFESKKKAASSRNEKLRFTAVVEQGNARVSLEAVGPEHPFYGLKGSDNIILFTTERYHERPMVIRGPGAGSAVTAAGVFADIIRIGNYSIQ